MHVQKNETGADWTEFVTESTEIGKERTETATEQPEIKGKQPDLGLCTYNFTYQKKPGTITRLDLPYD